MSSSTSSSEAGGAERPAEWARFALTFVAAATLLSAAFLGTAFLIDPYDTGRSPLALKAGANDFMMKPFDRDLLEAKFPPAA